MMTRHFLDLLHLSREEARGLLRRAAEMKAEYLRGHRPALLAGRTLGLLFEKPSLRTRVSFEAAIAHLGGNAIFLNGKEVGLGVREPLADFARVLSQYVDLIAVRSFDQGTIDELARFASVPVINALSDAAHPCQAMGDMLTIREELGRLEGVRLAFIGDGNNVARSLAVSSALVGVDFQLACPSGYEFPDDFRTRYDERFPDTPLKIGHDPASAASNADVIYTDVWTSMGQEAEAEARRQAFRPYQVDEALMALAADDAIFLHCLPAIRGEEMTATRWSTGRGAASSPRPATASTSRTLLLHLLGVDFPAATNGVRRRAPARGTPADRSPRKAIQV
ncbi:MAG: ornithine carbamoyltransferase [Isosphaeraceae bacterium]